MNVLKTTAILASLFAAFACGAHVDAAPIIFDTFTGTNGTHLDAAAYLPASTGHTPDVNVPGSSYINQNGIYVADLSGNTAAVGIDQGVGISIQSAGAYVKPTTLTISADLNLGDVTGTDNYFTRTVALGFMNALVEGGPGAYNAGGFANFQGLVIRPNGDLGLVNTYSGGLLQTLGYSGTFNPAIFHSLSYQIDTTTGEISNVLYDGTGYSFTAGLSTLTDANTKFAGFYVSGNGGNTAFIDNFRVGELTATPEPTSFGLAMVGFLGLMASRRRRKV